MSILVCGEALVDLVPDRAGGGPTLTPKLGGGPFNVAVALGRLGADVQFLSRISRDPFGRDLVAWLEASNVGLDHLQRGPELTTLALTVLDANGAAEYSFYADGTADRLVQEPADIPDSITAASFGTLSLLYEPGASVYASILARVHEAGVLTMLDPNIRPAAMTDADRYRARFRSWLPSVDILKVSVEDAGWLGEGVGGSTVDDWLAAGVTAVVVTRGGDGLSVVTADGETTVQGVSVDVADTIGAGDTVHGAILHHLTEQGVRSSGDVRGLAGEQWTAALTFAARAAAITVSRPGADPPWADEVGDD
ncbi:sugar kinase [Rhodococcus sp. Leaf7]|uniref:carbohydrate kinase family protein n=1 Tax=unclassified Rhodococcus (in: high G+C Gram-positive bacteria) TaxID=192944 RepID=UPI0006FABEC1|nr:MULTISPECIES: carbohydrate kinase [unclassified Rhodococcus (in: high G+C Gram-positive bacteria)]KQU07816.1 sugar kinase [Rhodococcus sp. Leaf7]KQU43334.1 sugar kinase [Rhodococcus sp. Leaf247]